MNLTKINIWEKNFHNNLISSGNQRSENKYYKALHDLYKDFFEHLENNIKNKNVLDFGCGNGGYVEKASCFRPSSITAIDISEKAIELAKSRVVKNTKVDYKVENCENTKLGSEQFDYIYGAGILHHLNLDKSVKEIERLLKRKGNLIFIEPMGTNPLINFYRKLTPGSRSSDEHPFKFSDIKFFKKVFKNVEVKYYGFFTLVFLPFYKSPENSKIFSLLAKIDKIFLKIPFFKFLAWSVIIKAEKN